MTMQPIVAFFLALSLVMTGAPFPPAPKLTSTVEAVLPGGLVTLTCHTSIGPVFWFLNGNKLRKSVFHVFQNDRQRLLIRSFTNSDNGTYTCSPANISKSNPVTVFITDPPVINLYSDNLVAYEGNLLTINGTIIYGGGSLNITLEDRRGYALRYKKELFVFRKSNFTFILPNVTLALQGLVTIKMKSFLRDTASSGTYKSKSILLTLIRKPNTPRVSFEIKWPMATANWSVSPGAKNTRYDPVSKFKVRQTYSNGTSTVQIFNESTKRITTIYSPGETITVSVTALGEHTQSGTSSTTIQIECFDPNRPAIFFVDSDTNFVLLNASGKAYPICLSNPLPINIPKGLRLKSVGSVARSLGEVHMRYDYTKFYYTNLDLPKLFETSQLVISNGSCPQIVSFCNESQYVKFNNHNLSDSNTGSPVATTPIATDPTLSSNASATAFRYLFSNTTATTSNTTISNSSLWLVAPNAAAAGVFLIALTLLLIPIFIHLKCKERDKTGKCLPQIREEQRGVDDSAYVMVDTPVQAYGQTAVNKDDSIEEAEICKRKATQEKTASTKENASEKETPRLPASTSQTNDYCSLVSNEASLEANHENLNDKLNALTSNRNVEHLDNDPEVHRISRQLAGEDSVHAEGSFEAARQNLFLSLAKKMGHCWRLAGVALHIDDAALENIEFQNRFSLNACAYSMLQTWSRSQGKKASDSQLIDAFRTVEREDLVDLIKAQEEGEV